MKLIVTGFKKLLKGELSKFGKLKLLIRCTRPKSIALFIVGSWLIFAATCLSFALLGKLDKVGQFGDFFGSLNTLFSGAALAGVIVSLMMQRKELHLQRREMQLTRREMEGQKKVMEAQQQVWEKQNFDSLFFSLYSTHTSLKQELECTSILDQTKTVKGNAVFTACSHQLMRDYSKRSPTLELQRKIESVVMNQYYFEPYILSLALLVDTVDNAQNKYIDKAKYYRIIRTSISAAEQIPIYFYGHIVTDCKFKNFIEDQNALCSLHEHVDLKLEELPLHLCYDSKAFIFEENSAV